MMKIRELYPDKAEVIAEEYKAAKERHFRESLEQEKNK